MEFWQKNIAFIGINKIQIKFVDYKNSETAIPIAFWGF